jgi:hypothetical protein
VSLLDQVLPSWHFRERHAIPCAATPGAALAAARAVTPDASPLIRLLFRLRGLPAARSEPVFAQLLRIGFHVAAEESAEVVAVGIGRPWRPGGALIPTLDFAGFDAPGYAKMALAFSSDGASLATETRVLLTDAASLRRFRMYWLVVRPWSGAIRRSWLLAARRRVLAGV